MIRKFDQIVRSIYASSLGPENWSNTLGEIGKYFDAEGAVIIFYNEHAPPKFLYSPSVAKAVNLYLKGEWWRHDIHAQRAIALNFKRLDVFSDYDVASPQEIETLPIFSEFFKSVGFGWLMCCVLLPDVDSLVALSVPRAKNKGPFTPDETEQLGLLGRHVEQALRILTRIGGLEEAQAALRTALQSIDAGVFALGLDGRILFANRAGEKEFDTFFAEVDGRMVPRNERDRANFRAIVDASREVLGSGEAVGQLAPRTCVVEGPGGKRLATWALPVIDASQWRFGEKDVAQTLVIATPLERDQKVDPAVLRDIFNLTLGEARLASLVGSGMTVRDAAGELGVTEGTARNVLKQVFRKLEINRQAELVHRVSNIGVFVAPAGGVDDKPSGGRCHP